YVIFQALGVYFNLYFLIPKYFKVGKYIKYFAILIITILATAAIIPVGYYLSAHLSDTAFETLFGEQDYFLLITGSSLPSTVASMTLAMSIKLGKNWIDAQKRQQLLEKEKIEAELKFLKSQFNPHFLFNTINSIFVLIHKNPDMASDSLAKFSDLMRYQLYECNEAKILLKKEINYLQNFIALGSLRLDTHVKVEIYVAPPPNTDFYIAPFVLMPFIENAFKHVSQTNNQINWLKVHLSFVGETLCLQVANSILSKKYKSGNNENSGIGLKNVRRRLDLVYPNQYKLETVVTVHDYSIKLEIQLLKTLDRKEVSEVEKISM
ncbi:MAG: histidine kinase, partial [Bacteroidota bacterium]